MALTSDIAAPRKQERLDTLARYAILDTPAEQDFDDLTHLAAELCETPVSLISFVGPDRQWFKARLGFPLPETDLRRSVCRYVLTEPDVMVIPDLRLDVRTADNPLVTGEPHIRFYAGAPLRTSDGHVLGSLCVIDTAPRPQGLTTSQAETLRRLARQVMAQLEARRLLVERDAALARQQAAAEALLTSEARWRGLFENLREGFILAGAVRDAAGAIVDWRYLEVNAAWSELIGLDGREVIGRTVRDALPGIEQEWVDLAHVVDDGGTVTFTRQAGGLDRWYDGRASATGPDTFSILFLEVTDRVLAARAAAESASRKLALAELADCLRASMSEQAMAHVTASIAGRTLQADRTGYGSVDAREERVDIVADWCAPGMASIAGRHRFRDFGTFIEDLTQGRLVAISDVRTDPRTSAQSAAWEALGVRALINAPVRELGELVAVCLIHWSEARELTSEDIAFTRAVADRAQVSVARLRAEERRTVLNAEISHRLKNTLAMVQAMAAQTLKGAPDAEALRMFEARVVALSKAHDLLLDSEWEEADLRALVTDILRAAGAEGRYTAEGPVVRLGPRATLSTSLLLHELTTTAQKHGALSRPEGRVEIAWRWEGGDVDPELRLDWTERGGPAAAAPVRNDFGSRLLGLGLVGTGGADLSYEATGFSASFRAPKRQAERA